MTQGTSLDKTREPTPNSHTSLSFSFESSMQLVPTCPTGAELPLASAFDCSDSTSDFLELYETSFSEPTPFQNTRDPFLLSYSQPKPYPDLSSTDAVETLTFEHLLPKPPKAFYPRTMRNHQFSLNRKYMICTLRSYPSMMVPGKTRTLPAFIHPQSLGYKYKDDRFSNSPLSNPLENCLAIMQMWSVKNKGNTQFIWRTIRMEQERVLAEVRRSSRKLPFKETQRLISRRFRIMMIGI